MTISWTSALRIIYGDDFIEETQAGPLRAYPYVAYYAMPTVYPVLRMKVKPGRVLNERLVRELVERAGVAARVTGTRLCVILGPRDCFYLNPDGRVSRSSAVPVGPTLGGQALRLSVL